MKEECPISKRQPLLVPNGHHRRGTGATVGDSHEGPLITRKKTLSFFAKMIIQTHKLQITPRVVAAWCKEGPTTQITSATHQAANLGPLGRTSASLEGQAPHHEISASLEGWTPPRANLRHARGRPELTTPTPTPPTRALNALARRGCPSQKRILATPTL
jgi:hypothetical protein